MDVLDAVRRPEYTGEQRCWPCTALNVVAVFVLAAVVGAAWLPGGVAVVLVGVGLVAVRGYVVPYTPRVGAAVAARLPLDFGHGGGPGGVESGSLADPPTPGQGTAGEGPPETVLGALSEAGVLVEVEEAAGAGQLAVDDAFRTAWSERMAALRSRTPAELADAAAAAAPWDATGEVVEDRVRIRGGGNDAWLSRPVAVAETAAVGALVDAGVAQETAAVAAAPLRMFLDVCPACGGRVAETTREDCCGATAGAIAHPDTRVLACENCGEELYVFEPVEEPDE